MQLDCPMRRLEHMGFLLSHLNQSVRLSFSLTDWREIDGLDMWLVASEDMKRNWLSFVRPRNKSLDLCKSAWPMSKSSRSFSSAVSAPPSPDPLVYAHPFANLPLQRKDGKRVNP